MTPRFSTRVSLSVVCAWLLAWTPQQAFAQELDLSEVEDWVARAIDVDATLAGFAAQARALEHEAEARTSNPFQPQLGYTGSPLPVETRQGPIVHQLSVSQTVPWGRYLADSAAPVDANQEALVHRARARRLTIREEVVDALIRIWELERERSVVSEQTAIYDDMLVHVGDAMVHGGAEYSDLLRMTLGSELLETRARSIDRECAEIRARLEATMQVTLEGVPLPADIESLLDYEADPLRIEELRATARAYNPVGDVAEAMAMASETGASVASRVLRPLPTFSAAWSVVGRYDTPLPGTGDGGSDAFVVGVRVPLPVFRRHVSEEARALEEQASAHRLQGESDLRAIEGELGAALARLDEASEQLAHYESSLLPLADDVVEALSAELLTGQREHTDYLLAFEQRLAMQLAVVELRAEAARAWWHIDALCAGELSGGRLDPEPIGAEVQP